MWAEIDRCGDGRVIIPVADRHSTDRVSRNSIDDKLTVPSQLCCRQGGKLPPLEPVGTFARGLPKNVFHEKPPFMDGH